MSTKVSENGQIMGFLAIGFVIFLGFAALAIDGGIVYANRRDAQNATDAASFAGAASAAQAMEANAIYYATFDCSDFNNGSSAMGIAHNSTIFGATTRASNNNYTIDNDISDNHGVVATCADDVNMGAYIDKYIDVQTIITRTSDTSFIHLLFSGPVVGTVDTVVRVRPRTPLAYGHAVVALNDTPCSGNTLIGVKLSGSSDTNINGGGIYSNGCLVCSGASFDADVTGGFVNYSGETTCSGSHQVDPAPQKTSGLPSNAFNVDLLDCSGLPDYSSTTIKSGNYPPGRYRDISMNNASDVVTLQPGLYCLSRTPNAVKITGGDISGDDITIFVQNGDVDISGALVDLRAPGASPDPTPAVSGLLLYVDNGDVKLTGNNSSYYEGTVYVPNGDIVAAGSSGTYPTFNTQLVGYNVEITGNATIDINFLGAENYGQPPTLDLLE
jgi:hypothetical protein